MLIFYVNVISLGTGGANYLHLGSTLQLLISKEKGRCRLSSIVGTFVYPAGTPSLADTPNTTGANKSKEINLRGNRRFNVLLTVTVGSPVYYSILESLFALTAQQ